MRFTSTIVAGAFAVLASAQSTASATTTATATTTYSMTSAQASMQACLDACDAGDVDCESKCIAVSCLVANPAFTMDRANRILLGAQPQRLSGQCHHRLRG